MDGDGDLDRLNRLGGRAEDRHVVVEGDRGGEGRDEACEGQQEADLDAQDVALAEYRVSRHGRQGPVSGLSL